MWPRDRVQGKRKMGKRNLGWVKGQEKRVRRQEHGTTDNAKGNRDKGKRNKVKEVEETKESRQGARDKK